MSAMAQLRTKGRKVEPPCKHQEMMDFMSSGKSNVVYHHSMKSPETTGTKTSYKLLSRDLPCTPLASKGQA